MTPTTPAQTVTILTGMLRLRESIARFNEAVRNLDARPEVRERQLAEAWVDVNIADTYYILHNASNAIDKLTERSSA